MRGENVRDLVCTCSTNRFIAARNDYITADMEKNTYFCIFSLSDLQICNFFCNFAVRSTWCGYKRYNV